MAKSKKGVRLGRPTRKELGLEPSKGVYSKVGISVIDACMTKHGSIKRALEYAAQAKVSIDN